MARGLATEQRSNLPSNPYPRAKVQSALYTHCEVCDRTFMSRDWSAHKSSKKHRQAEAKQNPQAEHANAYGFGDGASTFASNNNFSKSNNDFGSGETFTTDLGADNGGWGSGDNFTTDFGASSGNVNNGGGDRACFGCGQTGHQKRDCPSAGSGGGQACFGCGQTGHQKRDCPSGGGGQGCFNCGESG